MGGDWKEIEDRRRTANFVRTLTIIVATLAAAAALGAVSLASAAQAGTLSTLYAFCSLPKCADGRYPAAGLSMDAAGNLYGTTQVGGSSDDGGVVFELIPKRCRRKA
jgi:hypothetical protein